MNASTIIIGTPAFISSESLLKPDQLPRALPLPGALPTPTSLTVSASPLPVSANAEITAKVAKELFAQRSSSSAYSSTTTTESTSSLASEYGDSFHTHYMKLKTLFGFLKIDLPQDFGCLTPRSNCAFGVALYSACYV